MPSGFWVYWASVLLGTSSRSIPTRHALSISAATDQMARTTRTRMGQRSPSSASATFGESRGKGKNVVRQVTAKKRYARALAAVTDWCRKNRHRPIPEQHAQLVTKMRGHYAYYGISGNFRRLSWYAYQVRRIWQKWLSRRGSRFPWDRYIDLLKRHPIPAPRIVHRYTVASEALP